MGLHEWSAKIILCRQQQIDVKFIFVVHSSNFHGFDAEIIMNHFEYPIIYDYRNEFEKLNGFKYNSNNTERGCRTPVTDPPTSKK
jgi:hypothetical protein